MKAKIDIAAIQSILAKADLLYNDLQVAEALDEMANAINQHLQYKQTLCLSVMLGGLIPTGQLLPRLTIPLELDYIHATRYRETTRGQDLQWLKYPSKELQGQTVLIVDDILDEGLTLQGIVDYCWQVGAENVLTAVLVEKRLEQRPGLPQANFVGLSVPNRYVFGYGMDYQGQLRHAAGIYAVHGL